jgi:hypothetical protein
VRTTRQDGWIDRFFSRAFSAHPVCQFDIFAQNHFNRNRAALVIAALAISVTLVKKPIAPAPRSETVSHGATALILLIFLGILYFSFAKNENCLLFGLDGMTWRIMLHAQTVYRSLFTQTGVDPFQGSFDSWFPDRPEFLLPSGLGLLFTGSVPNTVVTYFVYGAFLLCTAYSLARTIGFVRPVALLGAFLLPIFALPGLVHTDATLYGLFNVVPHASQVVSLSILIVAAFWSLGRRTFVPTILLVFVPALCLMIAILGQTPTVVLMVPAVGLYGGASLLDARHWRENVPRIVAAILMIVIPAGLGTVQYIYGLVGYTAYSFFSAEFEQVRGELVFASSLFGYHSLGRLAIPLGLIGAASTALTESGRLRMFALTHLAATGAFLGFAVIIVQFAHSYQGPSPVYFETCFWPYDLIFAAAAILAAGRTLLQWLYVSIHSTAIIRLPRSLLLRVARTVNALPRLDMILLATFVALVAGFNIIQAGRRDDFCPSAGFNPIRPTAMTEIMRDTIALEPGKAFNGIAATIYGLRGKPSISWLDFHGHDATLWRNTGNDLRIVGLWQYGIPTLFQYFSFITPPYYLLLTDFLARPRDQQVRSAFVLARINEPIMQLWGVRFVITDIDRGVSAARAELSIGNDEMIRLIEFNDVNVGDYSPTEVRRVADFRDGLAIMHDPRFDGRKILVTNAALDGPFVGATSAKLIYERDGFSLHATSLGRSVLVLPIQYSHCWTVSGSGHPGLFRADLMQLGVTFTDSVDARLVFRFGPLFAGECRIEDLHDMRALRVEDARQVSRRTN